MSDWFWFLVLLKLNCCIKMKEAIEGTKESKAHVTCFIPDSPWRYIQCIDFSPKNASGKDIFSIMKDANSCFSIIAGSMLSWFYFRAV